MTGGFFVVPNIAHAKNYAEKAASYLNGDDSPIKTNNRYSKNSRAQKSSHTDEDRTEAIEKKSRKHSKKQHKFRNHKKSKDMSSKSLND